LYISSLIPTKEKYKKIKKQILLELEHGLSKTLYYHSLHHTLDILRHAERIAKEENINAEEDLFLLKVACLYHDSGFLKTYKGHEEAACKLVKNQLPEFDVSVKQIEIICRLIRATKIPQSPETKLEEIICDADLDYLGRPDFFEISNKLFLELKERKLVSGETEWNLIQIKFFKQHRYFTLTSKELRAPVKQIHLEMIETLV